MKLSSTGLDFIKGFESFVPYVYDDLRPPVKGKYPMYKPGDKVVGTLTVLYGHTDAARHPLKIKDCVGKTFSEDFGREVLAVDLAECEEDVLKMVQKPLTQGMFDACVSFTFNCGAGNFANIAKRINAGNYAGARAAFDLYVKSKGKVLRGLQRRRDGEQALWDADIPLVPTEVVDHPAEVDAPKKPTVTDVAKVSRKAKWLVWMKRAVDFVIGLFTLDTVLSGLDIAQDVVGKVKAFVTESSNVIAISVAILAALAIRYVIGLMREDVEEGRVIPSGEVDPEPEAA
jgi:lysozyme